MLLSSVLPGTIKSTILHASILVALTPYRPVCLSLSYPFTQAYIAGWHSNRRTSRSQSHILRKFGLVVQRGRVLGCQGYLHEDGACLQPKMDR
jgi:hypothetical protein